MRKASQFSCLTQLSQKGYFESCISGVPGLFLPHFLLLLLLFILLLLIIIINVIINICQYLIPVFLKILFPDSKVVSRALPDTKDQDQSRISQSPQVWDPVLL